MLKTRILVAAVAAACALGATTSVVSAAAKPKVTPVTFNSGPPASLHCKKGSTPVLHTMGKMSWACAKV